MPNAIDTTDALTTIRTDLRAICISLELSRSKWLIISLSPGAAEKMSKHMLPGGDIDALLERFRGLQEKVRVRTGQWYTVLVIQEAGLDGFSTERCWRRGLKAMSWIQPQSPPHADAHGRRPTGLMAKRSFVHCWRISAMSRGSAQWFACRPQRKRIVVAFPASASR